MGTQIVCNPVSPPACREHCTLQLPSSNASIASSQPRAWESKASISYEKLSHILTNWPLIIVPTPSPWPLGPLLANSIELYLKQIWLPCGSLEELGLGTNSLSFSFPKCHCPWTSLGHEDFLEGGKGISQSISRKYVASSLIAKIRNRVLNVKFVLIDDLRSSAVGKNQRVKSVRHLSRNAHMRTLVIWEGDMKFWGIPVEITVPC